MTESNDNLIIYEAVSKFQVLACVLMFFYPAIFVFGMGFTNAIYFGQWLIGINALSLFYQSLGLFNSKISMHSDIKTIFIIHLIFSLGFVFIWSWFSTLL